MEIPIVTVPLFPLLDDQLIRLLKSLEPDDWQKTTLARAWTVKDIASHLLDGNIRTISISRDGYVGDPPGAIRSYKELVDYLDQLNATWVNATRRISPALLIELLERTGKEYYECIRHLDPFARAVFSVDWAGEKESQNWFHVAREFTEKWHHQQQIREAVNRPGIMTREFYFPVMDTFMRALPNAYKSVPAPDGCLINVVVSGNLGGQWSLLRKDQQWKLAPATQDQASVEIVLDPDTAWKLFTKGIDQKQASSKMLIKGDIELGEPILEMVAVMAVRTPTYASR